RINVINLDASQIKVGTLDAATVRIINLDAGAITTGTLNVAVQINANSIVAGTLNAKLLTGDTAHLNSVDTGNITNNYDYHLQVSSKGLFNKTTNVGQLNLHSTQSGGSDWDAAFPGSMTYHFETSAGGQNTGLRFWKNHIMSLNSDQNTGLYLNPYGGTQVRVTSRTDDNTYLAINASAFNVASDRRFKSDIQDYEEDALSIVNSLRIRTYEKSGKREIGVIADEAPDNLLLKDEKGDMLSLYD
ncbi:tail fiber domain-containing protein, partial [Lactococcus lactis]|uniref:tail fiber domain-containing protein n=1 Tax=Lactococcus lactis TaxID=1358 RepID=UPI000AAAE7A6